MKTIEMNTNLIDVFSGTYESIWEIRDCDENGNEINCNYDHRELMQSIVKAYKQSEESLVRDLDIPWITKIDFTGFYSPSQYNYSTDRLEFNMCIDEQGMLENLSNLKNDDKFHQFLKDNYSSYDGFMSFTPNNYDELFNEISNEEHYHQSIAALIAYLLKQNKFDSINWEQNNTYDYWSSNGYMGLNYTVDQIEVA